MCFLPEMTLTLFLRVTCAKNWTISLFSLLKSKNMENLLLQKIQSIYNYTDYRKLLNDFYTGNKIKTPHFTWEFFAVKA